MATWFRTLGPPPDVPSAVALAVGLVLIWQGRRAFAALFRAPKPIAIGLLSLLALALSAGYVHHYLRGGPRIIDATSYWLEARALSEGHLTWPIDEPTASVRGRFLLLSGATETPRLGVIFPPGYPLVLAIGFFFGVPLWIGPIVAALLVAATYGLAKAVTAREDIARLAACLSVVCATLRYHTADTMSHGWAALLLAGSLTFALGAVDAASTLERRWKAAVAGVLLGWLFATRPMSAAALVPVAIFAFLQLGSVARLAFAGGALLPIGLFFLQQRAVTGSYFTASQSAYYAIADGPPGCFRYGFGAGIGCLHEHGSFVASVLPDGLDAKAVATIFLRRLRMHLIDIANVEPVALLVLAAPWLVLSRGSSGRPAGRLDLTSEATSVSKVVRARTIALAVTVVATFLVYLPFYFDGSYAGGGARLFADVLPLEHVLVATSVALLVERARTRFARLDLPLASAALGAFCLAGFGVHTVFEHVMLREREGGRPFFEPRVLARAKVDEGLLFVGTDHAFNLAYDPEARDPRRDLVVAREFGDDRDRLVWERLGRPAAHRYIFEGRDGSHPAVVAWAPAAPPQPYRFEAEAEWPPLGQRGGSLEPVFAQGTCAWGARLLAVNGEPDRPFDGSISFPIPGPGTFRVAVHIAAIGAVTSRFVLRAGPRTPPLATWTFASTRKEFACFTLTEEFVNLAASGVLEVTARGGSQLFIDAVALEPVESVARAR
jgi:hypothetical protein